MKKLLTVLCAIGLFINSVGIANAQSVISTSANNNISSGSIESNSPVVSNREPNTSPWPADAPSVYSEAAIVMDASTGAILYSKNIHQTFYPASITKVLTALLAIENSSLSETITFSKKAIFEVDLDSSRIGIDVGEQLTMEQSLYGILLESANEVSYGIAEHVSGDVESFAALMNSKAAELGCIDSNFVNPHGLPDPNHYTSAYDMALISKAAIRNETFRAITSSRTYVIPQTNIQEETRYLSNHHKLIRNVGSFEGAIGGKTGYTSKAKYTLVTFAERNGVTLISVILHCDSIANEYGDTSSLLDYAFGNYTQYNISHMEKPSSVESSTLFTKYSPLFSDTDSRLQVSTKGKVILPNTANYEDAEKEIILNPITSLTEGENRIGAINYSYNGIYVGSADIIYDTSVIPSILKGSYIPTPTTVPNNQTNPLTEPLSSENMKPFIIGIIIGIVVLLIGLYIILIEMPLRRRRNAYHQKKTRKKNSSNKYYMDH